MKKDLFFCDVTLKELLDLGSYAKRVQSLGVIFKIFQLFWYNDDDKVKQEERENNIRVGSIWIYLDDDNVLHLDFTPRFSFSEHPEIISFLEKLKDLRLGASK